MKPNIITVGLLLAFTSLLLAEPKAYDLVRYEGKGEGIVILFEFASGYPEASTIKIVEGSSKKATNFVLAMDDSDKMRFVPEKNDNGATSVSLDLEAYDEPPAKLTGRLTKGGDTVPISLSKIVAVHGP